MKNRSSEPDPLSYTLTIIRNKQTATRQVPCRCYLLCKKILVGALAHGQNQLTAFQHLCVGEFRRGERFTVQHGGLNVLAFLGSTFCHNSNGLSVGQIQCNPVKNGTADVVIHAGGIHWVEAHGREHQEGTHSTAVLVAADAQGGIGEPEPDQLMDLPLGLPGLTAVVIQVGDVEGMIALHGGPEAFAAKLDNLYVEQYDGVLKSTFLMQYPDATGLMGQFCMGNEPSFHIPYLYNYCGQAYKTQRKLHEIIDLWFTDSPLGICGDEDGGAMSAFLAFSAMGFYPVNPAAGTYDLGSPVFDRVEIDLPNGKTFAVCAEGASGRAKYIQAAQLNGEALKAPMFTHAEMMAGGELKLTMGERPNKKLFP